MGPPLTGHTDSIWSVLFNPEGTRILSAGADLSLRAWPAQWSEWPEMACERIKKHPILKDPERFFENGQDSIALAQQTKSACDQEFWQDM